MMNVVVTVAIIFVLAALLTLYFIEVKKDIDDNNRKAIKWANEMERKHNVHVALYEDNSGRIVDYEIYKL